MSGPVQCTNCGALMTPQQTDGRTYVCPYCRTQVQVGVSADQIAHGAALDLRDMEQFLSRLANTLQQGFASRTKIAANGAQVVSIEIDLTPDIFITKRDGARIVLQYKKMSRGIALKTKTLPAAEWVELLMDSLAKHANENAEAANVLAAFGKR